MDLDPEKDTVSHACSAPATAGQRDTAASGRVAACFRGNSVTSEAPYFNRFNAGDISPDW
jgi:hypothetical protein